MRLTMCVEKPTSRISPSLSLRALRATHALLLASLTGALWPAPAAADIRFLQSQPTTAPLALRAAGGDSVRSVAAADFNGDGHLDLAMGLSVQSRGQVAIMLNDGLGGFRRPSPSVLVPLLDGGQPALTSGLIARDIDGDGRADLLAASEELRQLLFFKGQGDGTLAAPVASAATHRPDNLQLADMNNDGRLDAITGSYADVSIAVQFGIGDGRFHAATVTALAASRRPTALIVDRLNGDAAPDVAAATGGSVGAIVTLLNNGAGQLGAPADAFVSGTALLYGLWFADFTGDGHKDLVASQDRAGRLTLLPGASNNTYGTPVITTTSVGSHQRTPQQIVDLNADGRPDIVFSTGIDNDNGDNVVGVALANANGTFEDSYWVGAAPFRLDGVPFAGDHGRMGAVTMGDFNGDGRADIAVATVAGVTAQSNTTGGVSILVNLGGGQFRAPRVFAFGGQGQPRGADERMVVADFTGDGRPDVAGAIFGSTPYQVLPGQADGTLGAAIVEAMPAYGALISTEARLPVAADFDGDGRQDISFYTRRAGIHGISTLYGDGDGTFTDRNHHNTQGGSNGTAPLLIRAFIDGDARPDLISVGTSTATRIDVFRYVNGVTGFTRTAAIELAAFGGTLGGGVAAGDVNGDGKADLIARLTGAGVAPDKLLFIGGNGDGTFAAPQHFDAAPFGTSPTAVLSVLRLADINNDGRLDLIGGGTLNDVGRQAGMAIRLGRGDGRFGELLEISASVTNISVGAVERIEIADLDADGRADLLFASTGGGVWTMQGRGDGTFKALVSHASGHAIDLLLCAPADLTGDGMPEVFTAFVPNGNGREYAATVLRNQSRPIGLTPDRGGAGRVTLRLDGVGLTNGSSVRLTRPGEQDVLPIAVHFDAASGDLIATFDLQGRVLGEWNVDVLQPNGSSLALLTGAFRIDPEQRASVWAQVVARSEVRLQRKTTFFVTYGNDGNVDATDLILDVALTGTVRLAELPTALAPGVTVRSPGILKPIHNSDDNASFHIPVIPARSIVMGGALRVRTIELGPFTVEVSGLVRTQNGSLPSTAPNSPAYTLSAVQSTSNALSFRATPSDTADNAFDYALTWGPAGGPARPKIEITPQGAGAQVISTVNVWVPDEVAESLGLPVSSSPVSASSSSFRAASRVDAPAGPYNLQGNRNGSFYQIAETYTFPHFNPDTGRLDGRSFQTGTMLRQLRGDLLDCLRDLGIPIDYDAMQGLADQNAIAHLGDFITSQAAAPGGVTSNAIADYMAGQAMDALSSNFSAELLVQVEQGGNPALASVVESIRNTAVPQTNGGSLIASQQDYSAAVDYAASGYIDRWTNQFLGLADQTRLERQSREALDMFLSRITDYCFRCDRDSIEPCDPDEPPNPPEPPDPPSPPNPNPGPGRGPGGPGGPGGGVLGNRFPGRTLQAADPNDKVGPAGAGPARHIRAGEPLAYTVFFENLENAGLPAADVIITDQLDPVTMDLDTLSLGPITVSGTRVLMPPAGLKNWVTTMDLRPQQPIIVRVEAAFNTATNLLTWTFTTLDPATNQPPDDTALGFLPPNVNSPEGEGSVSFFVASRASLQTGDVISNAARIVFDANAPIDTPAWTNAIDETAPAGSMAALGATQTTHSFPVQWSGSDPGPGVGGSGVRDYTISYSVNNGPWIVWLRDTPDTNAIFTGDTGRTYRFFARARDLVGLIQTGDPVAQATTTINVATSTEDSDGDGLPNAWEVLYGLDPNSAIDGNGADGDPDGDGAVNLAEYQANTHPRGRCARYFAEGSNSAFFDTRLALANPGTAPAYVQVRYLRADGTVGIRALTIPARRHATVFPAETSGFDVADFSTVIESDVEVVAERLMTWTRTERFGSHAETAVKTPARVWYLAEGATSPFFDLFYLIANPGDAAATIEVTYLRGAGTSPIVKQYTVGAHARMTIRVNDEASELAGTDVSGVVRGIDTSSIIVERAMYVTSGGRAFNAGHDAAGVTQPSRNWFFAEGATGSYFDMFLLLANPGSEPARVTLRYLRPSGEPIEVTHDVAPNSRFTINVEQEDPALANEAVSVVVTSDHPVIAERAMYWPWLPQGGWGEGHVSPGTTDTGTVWAVADGESGGANASQTYVLIANTSTFAGEARVTVLREDGDPVSIVVPLAPSSRNNVDVASIPEFTSIVAGKRYAVLVESLGDTPARIVVEHAAYSSDSRGVMWSAGGGSLGARIR